MIYLIYGDQYPVIKKRLNKLVRSILNEPVDEMNYVTIDFKQQVVHDLLYEASLVPFGCDKKVIVATRPFFLTTSKDKSSFEDEKEYAKLVDFINHPLELVDIIFFLEGSNINKKNEVYKALQAHGEIIYEQGLSKDTLLESGALLFEKKGVKISKDAIVELVNRTGHDLGIFMNECEKLALYSSSITLSDIEDLVFIPLEQNAFLLAESLIKLDIKKALQVYQDLRVNKEEPIRLISLMATQFRVLSLVSYLYGKGDNSNDEIAKKLGIHPYRVKLAMNNLFHINYYQTLNILDALYELDFKIKKGEIDPSLALELFILNFKDKYIKKTA